VLDVKLQPGDFTPDGFPFRERVVHVFLVDHPRLAKAKNRNARALGLVGVGAAQVPADVVPLLAQVHGQARQGVEMPIEGHRGEED